MSKSLRLYLFVRSVGLALSERADCKPMKNMYRARGVHAMNSGTRVVHCVCSSNFVIIKFLKTKIITKESRVVLMVYERCYEGFVYSTLKHFILALIYMREYRQIKAPSSQTAIPPSCSTHIYLLLIGTECVYTRPAPVVVVSGNGRSISDRNIIIAVFTASFI